MPKTAVQKNGNFEFWENYVWSACELRTAPPSSYPVLAQKCDELEFRAFISFAFDRRHHPRPLRSRHANKGSHDSRRSQTFSGDFAHFGKDAY